MTPHARRGNQNIYSSHAGIFLGRPEQAQASPGGLNKIRMKGLDLDNDWGLGLGVCKSWPSHPRQGGGHNQLLYQLSQTWRGQVKGCQWSNLKKESQQLYYRSVALGNIIYTWLQNVSGTGMSSFTYADSTQCCAGYCSKSFVPNTSLKSHSSSAKKRLLQHRPIFRCGSQGLQKWLT